MIRGSCMRQDTGDTGPVWLHRIKGLQHKLEPSFNSNCYFIQGEELHKMANTDRFEKTTSCI